MNVFVVHVYDAAEHLHDYYVHSLLEGAVLAAATDVVRGRFEDRVVGNDFEVEVRRVVGETCEEHGVGRHHIRCDAWRAHVDEMQVIPCETGPAYETVKKLAQMWRDQRTAPFDLLDQLAAHFADETVRERNLKAKG